MAYLPWKIPRLPQHVYQRRYANYLTLLSRLYEAYYPRDIIQLYLDGRGFRLLDVTLIDEDTRWFLYHLAMNLPSLGAVEMRLEELRLHRATPRTTQTLCYQILIPSPSQMVGKFTIRPRHYELFHDYTSQTI